MNLLKVGVNEVGAEVPDVRCQLCWQLLTDRLEDRVRELENRNLEGGNVVGGKPVCRTPQCANQRYPPADEPVSEQPTRTSQSMILQPTR